MLDNKMPRTMANNFSEVFFGEGTKSATILTLKKRLLIAKGRVGKT
jgi:hypothetical protein